MSLFEICEVVTNQYDDYNHLRLSAKIRSALSELVCLINESRLLEEAKEKPSIIYKKIFAESGYDTYLKALSGHEVSSRLENLEELGNAIVQYEEQFSNANLSGFLETIALDSSLELEGEEDAGQVNLMTVHGAKGLEFPYVFVLGNEENLFPSYRSLELGQQAEEEERRLFYVAMTRAMERLYLTFAQGRLLFGQLRFNGPSRFLMEIPEKYYQWKKIFEKGYKPESEYDDPYEDEDGEDQLNSFSLDDEVKEKVIYQKRLIRFPEKVKVIHSLYGEGLVLKSEGLGDDEKSTIKFRDGTKKKFMVKYTPLTII